MTAASRPTPNAAPLAEEIPGQNSKHSLETAWCFWFRVKENGQAARQWQDQHIRGHEFETVEDFWCMVNNMKNPFESTHCDYSVFRSMYTPDYDCEPFKEGGRIVIQLTARGPAQLSPHKYQDIWIHLLLALIGENFDEIGGESIGGLRLVTKSRGTTKFEVWTTSIDKEVVEKLCQGLLNLIAPLLDQRERSSLRAKFCAFPGNDHILEVTLPN